MYVLIEEGTLTEGVRYINHSYQTNAKKAKQMDSFRAPLHVIEWSNASKKSYVSRVYFFKVLLD